MSKYPIIRYTQTEGCSLPSTCIIVNFISRSLQNVTINVSFMRLNAGTYLPVTVRNRADIATDVIDRESRARPQCIKLSFSLRCPYCRTSVYCRPIANPCWWVSGSLGNLIHFFSPQPLEPNKDLRVRRERSFIASFSGAVIQFRGRIHVAVHRTMRCTWIKANSPVHSTEVDPPRW